MFNPAPSLLVAAFGSAALTFLLLGPACADDWPQWLGPRRDSVWRETGIVDRLPAGGLPVKWRADVSLGYSGPAVADGKVFVASFTPRSGAVTNNPSARDKLEGIESLACLDATTGKTIWTREFERSYNLSFPGGPRCTPTVDAGMVYVLGAMGDLCCIDAKDGRVVWTKNLPAEYQFESPFWGCSGHPLVDGDLLYCLAGGKGSVAIALDKHTGREVWRALSATEPGYCPPTMIEHGGAKQLLIWHPEALNSLDPKTGAVYWSVPLVPGYGMSITPPRQAGPYLYVSGIGNAAALLKLDDNKLAAEVLWRGDPKTAVYCANSAPLLIDDMIYGADCQLGALMGVRLKDGERLWQTFAPTTGGDSRVSHGNAFLVRHQDRCFLFSETGDLILAKLSPSGCQELGRTHLLDPTTEVFGRKVAWSHPAFAERCVFARNDQELVCVSLAAE